MKELGTRDENLGDGRQGDTALEKHRVKAILTEPPGRACRAGADAADGEDWIPAFAGMTLARDRNDVRSVAIALRRKASTVRQAGGVAVLPLRGVTPAKAGVQSPPWTTPRTAKTGFPPSRE